MLNFNIKTAQIALVTLLYISLLTEYASGSEYKLEYYHSCEYKDRQTELTALACNLFHEARGESKLGKIGVAFVTLNRVYSKRFPDTIVDVVYQDHQFSWHKDGLSDRVKDLKSWVDALHIASYVLRIMEEDYQYVDFTQGSLWYHSKAVYPVWASEEYLVITIDNHLFYNNDRKR